VYSRGKLLGGGCSGIVQLDHDGLRVYKVPWPSEPSECIPDLQLEARIYAHLGPHPRLVKFHGFDPVGSVLIMEYMPNGAMREYMKAHDAADIPTAQRRKWVLQALAIMTGNDPYGDVESDRVRELHEKRQFTNLDGVAYDSVISGCWEKTFESVGQVRDAIEVWEKTHGRPGEIGLF